MTDSSESSSRVNSPEIRPSHITKARSDMPITSSISDEAKSEVSLKNEAMPVFSGALRGAAQAFEELVSDRVTTYSQAKAAEQQFAHVYLGEAHAAADVAEILVREQIRRTLDVHAAKGAEGFDLSTRLLLKGQSGFLVDHCRRASGEMMRHAGARGFRRESPVQRFARDLNMLASHAFWDWDASREQIGRNRVGLEPTYPLL